MRRAGSVLALAVLLLSGCSSVDRPAGVVERWLTSINQGEAGEPQLLGDLALAEQIVPGWRHCSPGALDLIEVSPGGPARGIDTPYLVPFHVVAAATYEDLCGQPAPYEQTEGIASVDDVDGEQRVVAIVLGHYPKVDFPSEGGAAITDAAPAAWAASVGIGVALCLLVMLLMMTAGKHHTVAEDVVGEDVGHHHGGPA